MSEIENKDNLPKKRAGKLFSSEYQPANRGPKKRDKVVTKTLIQALEKDVSPENYVLAELKRDVPELFDGRKRITFKELVVARFLREAIMSDKPLPYIKELLDRIEGKSTIFVAKDEEEKTIDYEKRERVKEDVRKRARDAAEQRRKSKQSE